MQHLTERGWIDRACAERAAAESLDFHEIIGAIALKHSLLSPDQIDNVLNEMKDGRRFGEVARDKGYLTTEQVENLLVIQELHETFEIGQTLVLQGVLNRNQLLTEMADFFACNAYPQIQQAEVVRESGQ